MTTRRYLEWFWNAATALVAIFAVVIGTLRLRAEFFPRRPESPPVPTKLVSNWRDFGKGGVRMGPRNARVTIVEFADFQCPYCRMASADLHNLRRWYGDDVAVVYRHFPIHRFARSAALASECAGRQAAFEPFHDLLFAQPDSIGIERWTRFAINAGVPDTALFAHCLETPSAASIVDADSAAGVALGVQGTPTFLVNNLMVSGNPGFEQMVLYTKAALADALTNSR